MTTQRNNETSASFCRRMGWTVGTHVKGDKDIVEITAIGIDSVLARPVYPVGEHGREGRWTFKYQDWEEVEK